MTGAVTSSVELLRDQMRDQVRDRIRDAAPGARALRISGRGTWLDAGRPVIATDDLSVREVSGIVEYVPGDLTLTARAGTTLAEIADATAAHGQWLALDPHGGDAGTLGATVATASSGPLATAFGTPRDLVLGVEFITGTGVVARGGGRVVKNVAGFDLTRLLTGSWGSLGVITEVSVRLHARPAVDASFAVPLASDSGAVEGVWRLLRRVAFTPLACEVVNGALARALVDDGTPCALVRLGGNRQAVAAQRAALAELGSVREIDASVWSRLRAIEPADAIVFRLSTPASRIHGAWEAAAALDAHGAMIHATPARGVVRCIVPRTDAGAAAVHQLLSTAGVTRLGERLPPDAWGVLPRPGTDALARGIKRELDPRGVLNPGIFGEVE
ncbi:MAG TPA: FAD-binding protein [Gemmatimonadaceae bacterium]|nr:FAD-binding protein [Gemmatimonadaceae bacterium]